MYMDQAIRRARHDARAAIAIARESNDPITWITGNSYMPPLRDFGHAESVWQADNGDGNLWEAYSEEFFAFLANQNVYCDAPEYDNALYVVDMARWEYVESETSDSLNGDWQPIAAEDSK